MNKKQVTPGFDRAHDRFLCIDDTVYLIGASIKDLGKKWFGFVPGKTTESECVARLFEMYQALTK